ncbi:MAG: DegV family EDD domain-containing protein [Deltaproteobacteria bacterium]|nr:DegV family EDD domain-containing protein [Deltaproteobacteria bacterium]
MSDMHRALATGYHNLSVWADLLDRINVFPVADGDTGVNLRLSLVPLRDLAAEAARTGDLLARCAIGNSGNIAAAFFREFCRARDFADLAGYAARGREKAWQALVRPRAGTMLDVFDSLAATLGGKTEPIQLYPLLCKELHKTVLATSRMLPDLRRAGVVDAGALGMFAFFEGFFRQLAGQTMASASILELFAGKLAVNAAFQAKPTDSYCVNAVIDTGGNQAGADKSLAALGDSVVALAAETGLKVHIHTADRRQLRARLSALGEIVHWSDEAIDAGGLARFAQPARKQALHIMTDAAGSITREMARRHGITLLDSYILADDSSRPESLCSPADIYALMRRGSKVTTAQASVFERHHCYQSVCQRFGRTLYLCAGSIYTGNYDIARRWQEENDADNLLEVVDTGAASGRLGLVALLTARYAEHAASPDDVVEFAGKILAGCQEYVFIDQLQYLVAGGRVSTAGGFLAGLLHLKPVISPAREGVRKAGVVRSRKGQLAFALERLRKEFALSAAPVIMLQYSDNEQWVAETMQPKVRELLPRAEILLTALSLTSGVHMGPGTWSLAWAGGR